MKARAKRILAGRDAMVIAAFIWLPCLHFFFTKPASHFPPGTGAFSRSAPTGGLASGFLDRSRAARKTKLKRLGKSAVFRRAEFMSAKDMLQRAAAICVVYWVMQPAGFREFTGILNGTIGSLTLGWNLSAFLAVIYIAFYLTFFILVPVLVLAAGRLTPWQRLHQKSLPEP